ncbi:hypothetical protein NDU88_001196 [Pleurodeles waltl]|uniref:Uncharacterized protein n=1 Tax=Pleurodeles waltl TaxID=8319 RepID=A0AAV7US38_PLEWA|nr:hypothetical protein NDU88_001196 [Pleurodeles waltl]
MAPQFLKPASRVPGRPVKSAVRSAFGRVSSAPPATSRRGSGRRPRPARARSGPQPQLLLLCATPGADSRVPAPSCPRTEGRSRHKFKNIRKPRSQRMESASMFDGDQQGNIDGFIKPPMNHTLIKVG